mmetsp:Transcript_4235/g.15222  ORF Transcript_4235/g.15222 Transcript_4235/m.15222 type:complete len:339 (-) Transcript_4235:750-1766(-)
MEEEDYASSDDDDFNPEEDDVARQEAKRSRKKSAPKIGSRCTAKQDVFGEPAPVEAPEADGPSGGDAAGLSAEQGLVKESGGASGVASAKSKVDALWEQLNGGATARKRSLPNFNSGKPVKWTDVLAKPSVPKAMAGSARQVDSTWAALMSGRAPPKKTAAGVAGREGPAAQHQQDAGKAQPKPGLSEAASAALKAAAAVVKGDSIGEASTAQGRVKIVEEKDFAGEMIKVEREVSANSKAADRAKRKAGASGIDAILDSLEKKKKMSSIEKSRMDWDQYKSSKDGLKAELDQYKKSGYLDKQDFLQKADWRQYEVEREQRLAQAAAVHRNTVGKRPL